MTPRAAIDIVISDYDSVDPTDLDNSPLRTKYLHFLQHIYNYVWNIREWEWTYKEAPITVIANSGSAALPTDFQEIGSQGVLMDSKRVQFFPKPKYVVERLRRAGNAGFGSVLNIFAVWGGSLQLPYAVSTDTVFTLFYRMRPEMLADATPGVDMTIPDRYAHTVIIPGLIFRSQEKKQDARQTWSQQFNSGISQMAVAENPSKFENAKMPLARRGVW